MASLELLPAGTFNIVKIDKFYIHVELEKNTILKLPKKDFPWIESEYDKSQRTQP